MSENFDESITELKERLEVLEVNTIIYKLIKNEISIKQAISKIYLESMEKIPKKKI